MGHSLDEFRAAASSLPPSHVPTPAEAAGLLGALFAFEQFGDEFFTAAEADAESLATANAGGAPFTNADSKVLGLYAGAQDQSVEEATAGTAPVGAGAPSVSVADQPQAPAAQAPQGPDSTVASVADAPAGTPAATADDRDAQIADLKQQVQNLIAQRDRTRVDVERDTEDASPGAPAASALSPAPPSTSADAGAASSSSESSA